MSFTSTLPFLVAKSATSIISTGTGVSIAVLLGFLDPTITTSSNSKPSFKTILKLVFPLIGISCVSKPEKLIIKVPLALALRENSPLKSVEVPLEVPFSKTLAPGKGSLFVSFIVPLINV